MVGRIAVSAPVIGGAGGLERAVWSVVRALPEYRFDIYSRRAAGGQLQEFPAGTRVRRRLWWRELGPRAPQAHRINAAARVIRRRLLPRYDLHLHFRSGPEAIRDLVRARVHALNPSGSATDGVAERYDVVIMQAPSNEDLVPSSVPRVVLPPPWYPLAQVEDDLPEALPRRFFFTAMNPYGAVKGTDLLRMVAPHAAHPIVWCYSERSIAARELGDIPDNVVPLVDPSQGLLRALHRRCEAYVSFSRSEGFGWALADAMMYGAPVVSRWTGLLTIPEVNDRGVVYFDAVDELREILAGWERPSVGERDLGVLSPDAFRRRFFAMMDGAGRVSATA